MPPQKVCYSEVSYAFGNSGQLLCGKAELTAWDAAMRNIIEKKREILGVLIGRNREKIGMKKPDDDFIRHPAQYVSGSQCPTHSLCTHYLSC